MKSPNLFIQPFNVKPNLHHITIAGDDTIWLHNVYYLYLCHSQMIPLLLVHNLYIIYIYTTIRWNTYYPP